MYCRWVLTTRLFIAVFRDFLFDCQIHGRHVRKPSWRNNCQLMGIDCRSDDKRYLKKSYFGSNLLKANISVGFLISCRINISVCSCLIWRVLLEFRFLALFQNIVIYLADYFLHIQYLCNKKKSQILGILNQMYLFGSAFIYLVLN